LIESLLQHLMLLHSGRHHVIGQIRRMAHASGMIRGRAGVTASMLRMLAENGAGREQGDQQGEGMMQSHRIRSSN
jgi:hypothetical protein